MLEEVADTQLDAATYAIAIVELGRGESHAEMHDAAGRDVDRIYRMLEQSLGPDPYFCGSYSLADIAIAPHVMAATFLGFAVDTTRHPNLAQWAERVHQRPAVMRDNADVLETLQRWRQTRSRRLTPTRCSGEAIAWSG